MLIKLILTLLLSLNISAVAVAKSARPPFLTLLQCFQLQKAIQTGLVTDPKNINELRAKAATLHKEMEGLDYAGIIPWTEKGITAVKRNLALYQVRFMAKKPPPFDRLQKLGPARLNIDEIHFSQINASSNSGEYTVVGNAKALRNKTLDVSVFPKLRVWRDRTGKVWTLDHRRLAAIRLSGAIDEVDVEFVKEWIVNLERFKFSTETDGKAMFLRFKDEEDPTKEVVAVILNDGKRLKKNK